MRNRNFLVIIILIFVFAAISRHFSPTFAQDGPTPVTPSPGPVVPTAELACQIYHVTAESSAVRACAGNSCNPVTTLVTGNEICIRGEADNSDWLLIDLDVNDVNSPLHFINGAEVAPGRAGQTNVPSGCRGHYIYSEDESITLPMYQSASEGSPVVGTLLFDMWICVQDYSAEFSGWLYVLDSDLGISGWIQQSSYLRTLRSGVASATPTVLATRRTPLPTSTPMTPTITPAGGTLEFSGTTPLCQNYHVLFNDTSARTCAGTSCDSFALLNFEQVVCVRGKSVNPEWFLVDLSPDEVDSPLYAIYSDNLSPGLVPQPLSASYCNVMQIAVDAGVRASVRSCPSLTCPVVTALEQGKWVCAIGWDGEWVQADVPDGEPGVWVHETVLIERADLDGATPTPISEVAQEPTLTPSVTPTPSVSPTLGVQFGADVAATVAAEEAITSPTPTVCANVGDPNCLLFTPTPVITILGEPMGPVNSLNVTLNNLGEENFDLSSPADASSFTFTLPQNWTMDTNNRLILNLEYFENRVQEENPELLNALRSTLNIYLDDILISSINLNETVVGQQVLDVALPAEILGVAQRRHTVDFRFDAIDYCELLSDARAFIRSDQSFFHFEYRENTPVLDLALYPRPIANGSVRSQRESVILVLPDAYSDSDLQAAGSVASGLGLLTPNSVDITTILASELTNQQLQNNNLLVIGQPSQNQIINALYEEDLLPTEIDSDGELSLDGESIAEDEGLVQIIENPNNPLKAIIVVTGQTDQALVRAAQALGGPPSIMGIGGPVAIVTGAHPLQPVGVPETYLEDRTFAELGFDSTILQGLGTQFVEIEFRIPAGTNITDEAYVNLIYSYADLLRTGDSSIVLLLNDTPIGSRILTDAEDVGPSVLQVNLSPLQVNPQEINFLDFFITLGADWECNRPDDSLVWFTIDPASSLHLPIEAAGPLQERTLIGDFPAAFIDQENLQDLWISIPDEPRSEEISQVMSMLSQIGAIEAGQRQGLAPIISLGDVPDGTNLEDYNFVVIGRPSTNSFLSSLNPALPQPFAPDSDELEQVLDAVTYRLPPGFGIGVLQVLPSPWSPEKSVFVITGTNEESQTNAIDALLSGIYDSSDLDGNVVFVGENSVTPIDTTTVNLSIEILEEGFTDLQTAEAISLNNTATPEVSLVTSTPGPTLTPSITQTTAPSETPTSIFTLSPTPITPTPLPTFEPLAPEQLSGVETTTPDWVTTLVYITLGVVGLTILFGLIQLIRRRSSG